jgi:hypothetical protein
MPEKNGTLAKKIKENLTLIILIIAVLGYAVQAIGFFQRVPALEKKVDTYEQEISDLRDEITTLKIMTNKVHERTVNIETTTNQISEYLIQKALNK